MMRLSTMWSVDRTLRSDGGSSVAHDLLQAWRHDEASARFFRSSANFVYSFQRDGAACFLRFAHDSERTRASVETETKLLAWLTREGVHVATPIASKDGQLVVTSTTGLGTFHAVVFGAEKGDQLEPGELDDNAFASGARPSVISTPLYRNTQPSIGQPGDPWTTTC